MPPWLATVLCVETILWSAILAEAAHALRHVETVPDVLARISGAFLLASTVFFILSLVL